MRRARPQNLWNNVARGDYFKLLFVVRRQHQRLRYSSIDGVPFNSLLGREYIAYDVGQRHLDQLDYGVVLNEKVLFSMKKSRLNWKPWLE